MTPFNPGACLCDLTVLPRSSCLLGPVKFELDNRIANWDFGAVLTLAEPPKMLCFPRVDEMLQCTRMEIDD